MHVFGLNPKSRQREGPWRFRWCAPNVPIVQAVSEQEPDSDGKIAGQLKMYSFLRCSHVS